LQDKIKKMSEELFEKAGRLKETVETIGYHQGKSVEYLEYFLEEERYKQIAPTIKLFLSDIYINVEDAEKRKEIAKKLNELEASQRDIAGALGVGRSTINRDLNEDVPHATDEEETPIDNEEVTVEDVPHGTDEDFIEDVEYETDEPDTSESDKKFDLLIKHVEKAHKELAFLKQTIKEEAAKGHLLQVQKHRAQRLRNLLEVLQENINEYLNSADTTRTNQ
jgi:predicted transcriptional regulator